MSVMGMVMLQLWNSLLITGQARAPAAGEHLELAQHTPWHVLPRLGGLPGLRFPRQGELEAKRADGRAELCSEGAPAQQRAPAHCSCSQQSDTEPGHEPEGKEKPEGLGKSLQCQRKEAAGQAGLLLGREQPGCASGVSVSWGSSAKPGSLMATPSSGNEEQPGLWGTLNTWA